MQEVGAQDSHLAGQRVDRDLRAGRPIGEVEEWTSLRLETIPMDLRRLEIAALRQLQAREPARLGELAEAHRDIAGEHSPVAELDRLGRDIPRPGGESRHPGADGASGDL